MEISIKCEKCNKEVGNQKTYKVDLSESSHTLFGKTHMLVPVYSGISSSIVCEECAQELISWLRSDT